MKLSTQPLHYLTIDSVNAATTEVFAAEHGLLLELAEPRDLPRLEKQNALLIVDGDHLPPDNQDRVLASSSLRVAAIHSYSISDSAACFLSQRGILCSRKLDHEMFQLLDILEPAA